MCSVAVEAECGAGFIARSTLAREAAETDSGARSAISSPASSPAAGNSVRAVEILAIRRLAALRVVRVLRVVRIVVKKRMRMSGSFGQTFDA